MDSAGSLDARRLHPGLFLGVAALSGLWGEPLELNSYAPFSAPIREAE